MPAETPPPDTTLCALCRVTVLPAGRRLCFRCWRMMRPDERRAIVAGNGGQVPAWVDRGHD
jgi:hypothetical protein